MELTMKKLLLFFTIFCIGHFDSAIAMKIFKQRFKNCNWKAAALGTFAGGCTIAQYGLAFDYQTIISSLENLNNWTNPKIEKKIEDELSDVDPIVEQFAREQLSKSGVIDQTSLRIKQNKNENRWAIIHRMHHNWVLIPTNKIIPLKNALIKLDQLKMNQLWHRNKLELPHTTYEVLTDAASTLDHEAGHLINHDSELKENIMKLIIPIATATTFIMGKRSINSIAKKAAWNSTELYFFENSNKITCGLFLATINPLLIAQYSQMREKRADTNIRDNIHLLRAAKKHHQDHLRENRTFFQERSHADHLLCTHPHPEKRIAYFRNRIKELKQKNDPNYYQDPFVIKEQEIK
jgi:hypothetical protein